ncbi:hypothetical protein ACVIW2_004088 [Bradyrhizobium huanghuaihaiense]|jgi:hypothetical protein|uniref:Uncharacterized protein n=6 Tax=Bradyrhizobium TaxID=374 RepID=A0A809YH45_9BRAD|nr:MULTISPECIES: hypothetical protein [Bradyrhizobium]AJA65366.1 hypothetical protein RN69_37620 [Bradyrhizobium japonicum]AND87645.1 hypothetical protein AAV28_07355 [Bradyrhizobium diazoefficiens USDA 110]APG14719.1 hypothetical protein BKD09_40845 [Bradyrhizobium japonicum]APO50718.1 hypothetical protein BD122_10690 [Bradyrhizobium diazoefficiens]KGT75173.1 hypothetical protein MA20_35155 [Bradyrhizobium japonicum]
MLDVGTITLLRTILDEVCVSVPPYDAGVRAYVASRILEAATRGETRPDLLKQIGQEALSRAPTMWR